jgi:hypothetical protein
MQTEATSPKPKAFSDPALMAGLIRGKIYASLDEFQDFAIKAKEMGDLVRLAEELEDDAAADAGRGALSRLAAATIA